MFSWLKNIFKKKQVITTRVIQHGFGSFDTLCVFIFSDEADKTYFHFTTTSIDITYTNKYRIIESEIPPRLLKLLLSYLKANEY